MTLLALRNKMKGDPKGRVAEKISLMASFGENLRREREMRGITLEEISAATKISVRFLKSIENEEFSRLPGGIFSRSFVRAYARYLGLDEDPLMEEYQMAARSKGDIDLGHFSPPRAYSRPERRSRHTLWGVITAVGLLALGFTLWRYSRGRLQTPAVAASSSAGRAVPKTSAGRTVAAAAIPSGGNGSAANSQPAAGGVLAATSTVENVTPKLPPVTDTDGKLVLQVAATERSWVAIDSDGKTVMQGILSPNTVKTFKADASFDVLTGNAQGVILSLNGQTLKPLGREGEVKQVHLTWNSLKKQTSQ